MFHMTFNNHSGWKLLKACRKFIFSEYLYTLHVCKIVSICFEFDKVFFFFSLTSFAYVKKKKRKKEKKKVMSSTSNVYMN